MSNNCPDPDIRVFPPTSPEELDQFFRDTWPDLYGGITELSIFRDVLKRLFRRLRIRVISGSLTVSGLPAGGYAYIYVDHSDQADFKFCEYPRFRPVDDLEIDVLAVAAGRATDGRGFVIRVKHVPSSGVGASVPPDFELCWERRGMI